MIVAPRKRGKPSLRVHRNLERLGPCNHEQPVFVIESQARRCSAHHYQFEISSAGIDGVNAFDAGDVDSPLADGAALIGAAWTPL